MSRWRLHCCVVGVLLLTASFSRGQVGSPTWTAARLKLLQGSNAAARNTARQELMGVVDAPGFPAAYPAAVAPDLLALVKSANPRTQLNAAIVAEHLADKTANSALIPVATALLGEKSEPLALWGIKTARPFVANGDASLARQIAASVKAHSDSGPIAEEAYAALVSAQSANGRGTPASMPAVLVILELRTARYADGGMPPAPAAEAPVPVFLSITCWTAATSGERKQMLSDLTALACSAAQSISDGNNNPALPTLVRETSTALGAIGAKLKDDSLIAAAKALEGVNSGNAARVPDACRSLQAAVKAATP